MDEHRFGLTPEDDEPTGQGGEPPAPSGEPLSTTPPVPPAEPPPLAASSGGGDEPPRPPVPFFAEQAGPPPAARPPGIPPEVGELASYGSRVVGYLLDGVILLVASLALSWLIHVTTGASYSSPAVSLVSLAITFGYATILIARNGQTVGMGVAKIRCVTLDGAPLSQGRAAGRSAMAIVIGFVPYVGMLVDLLFPVWDRRRQTLHDKVAGTVVVKVVTVPDFPPPVA